MTTTTTLAARLRAWAKGIYPTEAGVELPIRQRKAIYAGATMSQVAAQMFSTIRLGSLYPWPEVN